MRRWGNRLEIDGSFYDTELGKRLGPTARELAQLVATKNPLQYEGNAIVFEETIQNMLREIERDQVGRSLIGAISCLSRTVRIIPLTSKEQSQLGRVMWNPLNERLTLRNSGYFN